MRTLQMEISFYKSQAEFQDWLKANHSQANELWVGFHKKNSGESGITYVEARDEALCFGWIDGVSKRVDETSFTIRFSPRRLGSIWSVVNIERVGELLELGRMQPAGIEAFNKRSQERSGIYAHEQDDHKLDDAYEEQFRANEGAWTFFQAQAPWYRRTAKWWVLSAKREETRLRRLATLIHDSEEGRRLAHLTRPKKA